MARAESQTDLDRVVTRQQTVLMVFNIITFLVALGIFGVCLWIRFDLDFREWVREIEWYSYWYAMYVIMISTVIVAVTSGVSGYGVYGGSSFALVSSIFLYVLAMILELVGAIVILVYGVEESEVLTRDLREVFFKLIYRLDHDERANRILKIVQEYVRCCGANGSEDYIRALKPVPMECRDPIDGGEYRYGCAQQFAWWLEPWSACLAGVCLFFILSHVVQIVLTSKLNRNYREYDKTYTYEH